MEAEFGPQISCSKKSNRKTTKYGKNTHYGYGFYGYRECFVVRIATDS